VTQKWFVLSDGVIHGPFVKDDIENRTQNLSNPMIWGRGQTEWLTLDKWNRFTQDFENHQRRQKNQTDRQWKIQASGVELKAMNQDQMIEFLRTKSDLSEILIWTEGYSEWKEVFQIHKIMDELGVSRRAHPRVPIMGTVQMEGAQGNFSAKALSISEGGMGITDSGQVKIGEKFKMTLKSPNLFTQIHATGEIVFVGADNYAGLKFIGLHSESKSAIIEYVKKLSAAPQVTS
jgi:hypothetical protein